VRNCNVKSEICNIFRCALINARSICNKLPDLHHLLYTESYDVILITETWSNSNVPDSIIDLANDYRIYRRDRSDGRHGGGVCILVKRTFGSLPVNTGDFPEAEICCVDASHSGSRCRFVVAYRPPDADSVAGDYLCNLLKCCNDLLDVKWPCVIAGDFNAAHVDWTGLSLPGGKIEQLLSDFAISNSLLQVVSEPTRNDNLLDVVLVNEPCIVGTVNVEPPFSTSDHCLVQFMLALESAPQFAPKTVISSSKYYVWSEADYTGMAGYLDHVDWNHLFSHNLTADAMWAEFHSVILNAIDCYVPSKIHLNPEIRSAHDGTLRPCARLWLVSVVCGVSTERKKPMINSHLHIRML
jgi:hypothetical protein